MSSPGRINSTRSTETGFSVIQISILLVVGGLIFASILAGGAAGDYNQKVASNITKLDAVETAMLNFMSVNGRRPCPADGSISINDPSGNFGVEADVPGTCKASAPGGIAAPLSSDNGSNIAAVAGMIPTKSLDLPDDYAFDAWGRQFTYVVDTRATVYNSCYFLHNSGTKGIIAVNNVITKSDGTDQLVSTDNVMAAYISYGPTGHGAFPGQGSTAALRINKGISDTDSQTNAGLFALYSTGVPNFMTASGGNVLVKKDRVASNNTVLFDDTVYYRKDTMNVCTAGTGLSSFTPPGTGFLAQGSAGDKAGSSLAVGDINNDGVDDLIIGAPGSDKVYVLFGSKTQFLNPSFANPLVLSSYLTGSNTTGFILKGTGGTKFGQSVATGDINGDGVKDIIIGAPGDNGGDGAVYVVFGGNMASGDTTWLHNGLNNKTISGGVLGGNTGINGTNGFVINGVSGQAEAAGTSVAAGNITGHTDGTQDVILGAPNAAVSIAGNPSSPFSGAGKVYVVIGSTSGSPPWAGGTFTLAPAPASNTTNGTYGIEIDNDDSYTAGGGAGAKPLAGTSVAAGDINGDGIDDLIIGAPGNAASLAGFAGKAYVMFGRSSVWTAGGVTPVLLSKLNGSAGSGKNGTYGFIVSGATSGDLVGTSVAAGDITGDSIADLIIGAPGGNSSAGYAYAMLGSTSSWSATYALSSPALPLDFQLNGSLGETAGSSVATGCSVNGSGIASLLVGAPSASTPIANSCSPNPTNSTNSNSYVFFGSSNGWRSPLPQNMCTMDANNGTTSPYMNGFFAVGQTSGDKLGTAMASLDISGQGKCAVAIGAPTANNSTAGYVYVVYGQSSPNYSFDLSKTTVSR